MKHVYVKDLSRKLQVNVPKENEPHTHCEITYLLICMAGKISRSWLKGTMMELLKNIDDTERNKKEKFRISIHACQHHEAIPSHRQTIKSSIESLSKAIGGN